MTYDNHMRFTTQKEKTDPPPGIIPAKVPKRCHEFPIMNILIFYQPDRRKIICLVMYVCLYVQAIHVYIIPKSMSCLSNDANFKDICLFVIKSNKWHIRLG